MPHSAPPPPPGQEMQGALFTQWTPDRRHSWVKPITTHLDPPLPLELKDCLGLLDGEGGEDVPTFGQLLLLGVGLEAPVVLATWQMVDDIFSPPEVEPGPPVWTQHPLFLSRSAHDISPVIVHAGGILTWNGAYETSPCRSRTSSHLSSVASPSAVPAWTLMRYWGERATKVEMWQIEG